MSEGRVTISIEEYAALMESSEELRRLRLSGAGSTPTDTHRQHMHRLWANSTAREIALSMAECLTEGRPVGHAITRAETWLLRGRADTGEGERLDKAPTHEQAEERERARKAALRVPGTQKEENENEKS